MGRAARFWAAAIARRCTSGKEVFPKPEWAKLCETRIFPVLNQLRPCLPLYVEILKAMKQDDFKPRGLIVNLEAQAKLGEFYLCCAYTLKPRDVEAAEGNGNKLLQLAHQTAEQEVEPWIATVREFVDDYDASLAAKLEEAAKFKASDEATFWNLSFLAAAPEQFSQFLEEAERRQAAEGKDFLAADVPEGLEPLADAVYVERLSPVLSAQLRISRLSSAALHEPS
ncbi:hypothetical protein cyc_04568 [Cyclospora cayetanensis]|uniref:Uncharacterized protein n=1 Tax=Cyclospora cayetanensis TaxID=88456 RepID=A0A1D3CUL3_9EIME|nr:hypothetical protein cyc_04568 [Cyclospora cayetanensis]